MAYAEVNSAVSDYIKALLETNKVALGLGDVYYGDQQLLPRTPAACVLPGSTATELVGAPMRMQSDFEVQVLVYHCKIQDSQETERECVLVGEALAAALNNATNFGGLVVQGFVTAIEPGFVERNNGQNWYRSTRITWKGFSRYIL